MPGGCQQTLHDDGVPQPYSLHLPGPQYPGASVRADHPIPGPEPEGRLYPTGRFRSAGQLQDVNASASSTRGFDALDVGQVIVKFTFAPFASFTGLIARRTNRLQLHAGLTHRLATWIDMMRVEVTPASIETGPGRRSALGRHNVRLSCFDLPGTWAIRSEPSTAPQEIVDRSGRFVLATTGNVDGLGAKPGADTELRLPVAGLLGIFWHTSLSGGIRRGSGC